MPHTSNKPADKPNQARTCCLFIPLKFGVIAILLQSLIWTILPLFLHAPTIYVDNSLVLAAASFLPYINAFLIGGMLFFLLTDNAPGFRGLALANPLVLVASFAFAIYASLVIAQEYKHHRQPVPQMSLWPFVQSESVGYWASMGIEFVVHVYWAFVLVVYSRVFVEESKAKMQARVNRHKRQVV